MLVLGRRVGQRIIIGDDIVIEVLGEDKFGQRLGITAPKGVEVHREEVYNRIQAEKVTEGTK